MAPSHSEVQEFEAASGQDIEDSDIELDLAWEALFPEVGNVYDGPGALRATDIMKKYKVTKTTARKRAARAVRDGRMVEVSIRNDTPSGHLFIQAWVPTQIYNEFIKDNTDA